MTVKPWNDMTETERMFAYEKLRQGVIDYLSEHDSPCADLGLRYALRDRLRGLVGTRK